MKQSVSIVTRQLRGLPLVLPASLLLLTAGCMEEANQYAAPPPPEVTVAVPKVQDVTEYRYFTGQTAAKESVAIRARVEGFLQEIHFKDGQFVEAGELLFTIDPREYEAEVARAEAELLNTKTALDFAENNFQRIDKAGKAKAVAELEVVKARADRDKAKAYVAAAEAALQRARLNLSYTRIESPISGRVSRRQADVGNLVGTGGGTVLTNVVSVDPVYVYVSVSERDVVRLLRGVSREQSESEEAPKEEMVRFDLALVTEEGFPHPGEINYLDNRVDPESGTIQMRGEAANPEYLIIPGLFARIRIPTEVRKDALLVPERSLGVDQAGRYLLVLDERNEVDRRPVETGAKIGNLRVVTAGLTAEDRVVVKGILRARPGSEVKPVTTTVEELERELAEPAEVAAGAQQSADIESGTPASEKSRAAGTEMARDAAAGKD